MDVIGNWMNRLDPEWSAARGEGPSSSEAKGLVDNLFERSLGEIRARLRKKPAGLLKRFETGLAHAPSPESGAFWSVEADRAWARASFYSAVDALGSYYLDSLSDEAGAKAYAEFLQVPLPGLASDFVQWYSHLAASKRGENPVDAVAADAGREDLGYLATSRSMREVQVSVVAQRRPAVLSAYARTLDTRPDARYRLLEPLDLSSDTIHVLNLCRHCVEPREGGWNSAWCANKLGDGRALLRTAADPSQNIDTRLRSLAQLRARDDLRPEVLRAQYRRLVEEAKFTRPAVTDYILYLDSVGDFQEQLRVVDGYLANNPTDDLMHDIYIGRRAHCLSRLGRHGEAWKLIEPLVGGQQGSVMMWGAEILGQLGRTDESLALARATVQRYPD